MRLKSLYPIQSLHRFHRNIFKIAPHLPQVFCSLALNPISSEYVRVPCSPKAETTHEGHFPNYTAPTPHASSGPSLLFLPRPRPLQPQWVTLLIRFSAIVCALRLAPHSLGVCSKVRPKVLIIPAAGKDCLSSSHTDSARHRRLLQKRSRSELEQAPERPR